MKIDTILFDLDGTLINTNELIIESFKHTFKIHFPDLVLTEEDILEFIGPTLHQTFSNYCDTEEEIEAMIKTYKKHNLSSHEEFVTIYEGVIDTLETLIKHNYQIAIVTSKMEDSAKIGMDLFDLGKYFDVIGRQPLQKTGLMVPVVFNQHFQSVTDVSVVKCFFLLPAKTSQYLASFFTHPLVYLIFK